MKHLSYVLFFFGSVILMQSCNKSSDLEVRQVVIDTNITSGVQYTLNLRPYGNTATITKQASSYATSEIVANSGFSTLLYQYSSLAKVAAVDQVVLGVSSGSRRNNNCNNNSDSTVITINFTVK